MKIRVLVPIADGSEEIESVTVVDILRRAGVDVFVSAVTSSNTREITASRGVKIVADDVISNSIDEMWDAIVSKSLAEKMCTTLSGLGIHSLPSKTFLSVALISPCTISFR